MGNINTTVTANFGSEDGSNLPGANEKRWLLEVSNRPQIVPTGPSVGAPGQYFRVHPSASELRFEVSSGSISSSATNCQKQVYETVSFSGGDPWVALKYPGAREVTFELVGTLIPAIGSGTVTVLYDSLRNILRASRPCFGMVRLKYRAPYDLWLARFAVRPITPKPPPPLPGNPSTYPDPEDDQPSNVDAMMILGKRSAPPPGTDPDEIVCSLTLTPPGSSDDTTKDETGWSIRLGTDSLMPKLQLFVDPKNPVRLITKEGDLNPTAGCKVICVPQVMPDFQLTAGQFVANENATIDAVGEVVTFSGSASASLRYQPAGTPAVVPVGQFVNRYGHAFTPIIAKPGETVRVVDWITETEPKNPRDRVVGVDELVCADPFGNAIPAYGIVKVDYGVTANTFDYLFDYDENTGEFKGAWVVAIFEDQTFTLQLQPPVMKSLKTKK